jgi:coenzyme PQQ biosynthesis protein PqqD
VSSEVHGGCKPRLARKAKLKLDPIEHEYLLLSPERGLKLNPTAAEILRRCDGERTIDAIAEELASLASVPVERVKGDALSLLADMVKRGLVCLA